MNSYHNHCNWSDGSNDMRDMFKAAREAGFREFGLSDHFVKTPFGDNEITSYSMDKSRLAEYVEACLNCKKNSKRTCSPSASAWKSISFRKTLKK